MNKLGGVADQIPRNSLALLMIAQVVVMLPLSADIPFWIVGVCLFCGFWRTQVHRGIWGFPSGWIKAGLVLSACAAVVVQGLLTGIDSFSLEAATSLLVLAFALKLIEMKTHRDAYLVIFLSYFLISTKFLYDQSMLVTAYEIFAAVVVTAALVGMNQMQTRIRPLATLRTALALICQAIPLMLVLFLLFPRIAPLWSIPVPSSSGTGISDKLTPGDIARLGRSDELAFRVEFEGEAPAQRDLYWRGLVYSNFKFGTWSIAEPLNPLPRPAIPLDAQSQVPSLNNSRGASAGNVSNVRSYEIFLEPTQSEWLYTLDVPVRYSNRSRLLGDFRLVNPEPVLSVLRYQVDSDPTLELTHMNETIYQRETYFEATDNPRIQEYARELYRQTGSVRGMVAAMMAQIRRDPYVYTLNPPRLPRLDSIDTFWFDTRRGFCSHYAGAVVFALRAAGIPARMVGGYQGGEFNPVTGHMVVRQYDAHAWIEAYAEEGQWLRFDPTSAVAPARVESGLNAALSNEERDSLSYLSSARRQEGSMVTELLRWGDSLEYRWNRWVVGYDADSQSDLLSDLLGKVDSLRVGIAILVGSALSVGLVGLILLLRRRPVHKHPVEQIFNAFCKAVMDEKWISQSQLKFGNQLNSQAAQSIGGVQSTHPGAGDLAVDALARRGHETPAQYVSRLAGIADYDATTLVETLQTCLYNPDTQMSFAQRRQLRQQLRKLRFKLAFGVHQAAS